ncbi:class A beta-lactamase [Streptomyces sp. NPDC090022]|uniref:class A beta-lactamase n=1 Tax=Streptomyces sp. NPDC090022 TaxID=3365920 RepID=UPI003819C2D5
METTGSRPPRRTALALGAAAVLGAVSMAGSAHAAPPGRQDRIPEDRTREDRGRETGIRRALRALEAEHGARLGVYAYDTGTGRVVRYRADERFPMCSVFKTLAVAAVLRDLDRDGEFLARRIHYTQDDVDRSGYAPKTKDHVATGMTVEELCGAAISYSDNTAANLLLTELGGPQAVTDFCRSTGDDVTRLDRWEPELNSAEPGRETDTTTPSAIGRTYARLVLGNALGRADRARLTDWLLANTTSGERFRKGLPADWRIADKTGGGKYATNNDVGLGRPPGRSPVVLAVLTTKPEAGPDAPADNPLVAKAAELVERHLR